MRHTPAVRLIFHPALAVATFVLVALGVPAVAAAESETVDRTVQMAPDGTLTVKNFSGRVDITGTDGNALVVHAVRRAPADRLKRITLEVTSDGKDATIEANHRSGDTDKKENVVETDLTIQVPRGANLAVTVFSSPVTVKGIAGTSHRIKGFSSDLKLEGLAGAVEAETFSGGILLTGSTWADGQTMSFKTFSGDISVQVPQRAAGRLDFDSFSGDLNTDVPLAFKSKSKRRIDAELGSGGSGTWQFKTFSGDVHLTKG